MPPEWLARVETVARIVDTGGGPNDFHARGLELCGTCVDKGVPLWVVPAFVEAVARRVGYRAPHEIRKAGERTAERWSEGFPVRGLPRALELRVADALAVSPAPVKPKVDLVDLIRSSPAGQVMLLGTEAGSGKTRAAMVVAKERAESALPGRALDVKTAISVDKTALAIQVQADLEAMGVSVQRYFGPLSHLQADGSPTCRFHEHASALTAGGQSVQTTMCGTDRKHHRCPEYEACPARAGVEGPAGARVVVGPHPLLGALDTHAGSTGLLVIDEPPAMSVVRALTRDVARDALEHIEWFRPEYADAVRPLVDAALAWLTAEETGENDAFDAYLADGVEESAAELASRVAEEESAPPLRRGIVEECRHSIAMARRVGHVSGAVKGLVDALGRGGMVRLRVVKGVPMLVCIAPNATMQAACRRKGRTVIADANARVHLPIVGRVIGYEPKLVEAQFPDGARVDRTLFRSQRATMRGMVGLDGEVTAAGRALVASAVEWMRGEEGLLVTFKAVLEQLRAELPPHVRTLHFGATRGVNAYKSMRQLVTVGDPRPNIGAVADEADMLGVDAEGRAELLARAELEQAHGRLRTVHRVEEARAAHFGMLRPSGWGWGQESVAVVEGG